MMNITSTEFKKQLGTYLASTHEGPIQIEKAGQPVAVVLSPSEYAYLHELEEKILGCTSRCSRFYWRLD